MKTFIATLLLAPVFALGVTIEITVAARNNAGTATNQTQVLTLTPQQSRKFLAITQTNVTQWIRESARDQWLEQRERDKRRQTRQYEAGLNDSQEDEF